jgi:two-component system NtrC family sensor kinase
LEAVWQTLDTIGPSSKYLELGIIDAYDQTQVSVGPEESAGLNKDGSKWYGQVWAQEYAISDVLQTVQNEPYVMIAVKQMMPHPFLLYGSVKLEFLLQTVGDIFEEGYYGHVYVVDSQGEPRLFGPQVATGLPVSYLKTMEPFQGVRIEEYQDNLVAFTRLEHVPWLCLVQVDKDNVFGGLKKARIMGLFAFVLGSVLILFSVLLTTDYLVHRLEVKRKNIRLLDQKLLHMSRMASSMQLSYGFFRELKDVFSNVDMAVNLIQDSVQRKQPNNISTSLTQIKSEMRRCQRAIDNFLCFIRPPGTSWLIRDIQINDLLNAFLSFIRNELSINNIVVYKELAENLPIVRSNASRIRQAVQNLFLTVMADMPKGGQIYLQSLREDNGIRIRVTYPPCQLDQYALENIIDPLWIDQVHGPGVWLALCVDHAEKLQGSVQVEVTQEDSLSVSLFFPLHLARE